MKNPVPAYLKSFLPINLTFRSIQRDEQGNPLTISEVIRLESDSNSPLRFEKTVTTRHARLISYEYHLLRELHNTISNAKVVQTLDYHDSTRQAGEQQLKIVTKDAGVDLSRWYQLPVSLDIVDDEQAYHTAFCHPMVLLKFVQSVMNIFHSLHKESIYHCDIKEDQICIPFTLLETANGYNIVPDFTNTTLIDFGNAIWSDVPIADKYNPLPFSTSYTKPPEISENEYYPVALPYQAHKLIDSAKNQAIYFSEYGKYSFNKAVSDIDYSVDLYSLGYLLRNMQEQHIKPYLNIDSPLLPIWMNIWTEYNLWVEELLTYDNGIIDIYSRENLPHLDYLAKIESWVGQLQQEYGFKEEFKLQVVVNEGNQGNSRLSAKVPSSSQENTLPELITPTVYVPETPIVETPLTDDLGFEQDGNLHVPSKKDKHDSDDGNTINPVLFEEDEESISKGLVGDQDKNVKSNKSTLYWYLNILWGFIKLFFLLIFSFTVLISLCLELNQQPNLYIIISTVCFSLLNSWILVYSSFIRLKMVLISLFMVSVLYPGVGRVMPDNTIFLIIIAVIFILEIFLFVSKNEE